MFSAGLDASAFKGDLNRTLSGAALQFHLPLRTVHLSGVTPSHLTGLVMSAFFLRPSKSLAV